MENAIWVARSLFDRGKVSGSAGNLSFKQGGRIYISGSGTCFGRLSESDFACIALDGGQCSDLAASKEWPLHAALYQCFPEVGAVLHTHSFYATLWSCLLPPQTDMLRVPTPYLKMRVGSVQGVPYAEPGSRELFDLFGGALSSTHRAYLLERHGPIVAARDILQAFFDMEELEESAKIAVHLRELGG